jgi:hypothetical protein
LIEDLVDRLRLVRSAGIGPVTYRQLIARFSSASAALAGVPDLARRGGGRAPSLHSRDVAEREIAKVEKLGAKYLALGQGLYPRLLAELENAPPLLMAKGNLTTWSTGRRWRSSARATPRRRRAASRAARPMTLANTTSSSSPVSPAESTVRRTIGRWKAERLV